MPDDKKTQVIQENGVTVVVMGKEYENIDETVIDDVREFLLSVSASADPPRLLVDLSQVEFFGSSFIELLFRVWHRMKAKEGGIFGICGLNPYCSEVLEVTHLNQLWSIYSTREEALKQMQSG